MGLKQRIIGTVLAVATMVSTACVGVGAYDATSTKKEYRTTASFNKEKSVYLYDASAKRPLNVGIHTSAGTGWYLFLGDRSWCDMWASHQLSGIPSMYATFCTAGNGPDIYYSSTFLDAKGNRIIRKNYNKSGYTYKNYHEECDGKIVKGSSFARFDGYTGAGVYVKTYDVSKQTVRFSYNGG